MKNNMNELLKCALTPDMEPQADLNRNIFRIIKENEKMEKENRFCRRKFPAVILAAVLVLAFGSITAMAAYHYLSPANVAVELEDNELEKAFLGKDAVLVNETQKCGDYYITLLGSVAGKNISDYFIENTDGINAGRIYTVVAIERADGVPMPDTSSEEYGKEPFYVSHYIRGLDPKKYSIMSMGGGYTEFVKDGIMYHVLDMENIEMFADKGIYVGVSSGIFYDTEAYIYDENTGVMIPNETFDGVNALFILPVDESKADSVSAQKYLEEFEQSMDAPDEPIAMTDADMDVEAFMEKITPENLNDYAKPVEGSKQICKVNEDGVFDYFWTTEDGAGGSGTDEISNIFPDGKAGTCKIGSYSYSEDGLHSLHFYVFTLNEDGMVTFEVYEPIITE